MLSSGGCGKTVSPCLCAHSTSRLSSSHCMGKKKHSLHSSTIPLMVLFLFIPHSFSHPQIEGHPLTFSGTGIMHCFSSHRELEKPLLSLRIFGWRSHSCLGLCACVFHTGFNGRCMYLHRLWPCMLSIVVCICVSLANARNSSSSPSPDCVRFPLFHYGIGLLIFPGFGLLCIQLPCWVSAELFWPW